MIDDRTKENIWKWNWNEVNCQMTCNCCGCALQLPHLSFGGSNSDELRLIHESSDDDKFYDYDNCALWALRLRLRKLQNSWGWGKTINRIEIVKMQFIIIFKSALVFVFWKTNKQKISGDYHPACGELILRLIKFQANAVVWFQFVNQIHTLTQLLSRIEL